MSWLPKWIFPRSEILSLMRETRSLSQELNDTQAQLVVFQERLKDTVTYLEGVAGKEDMTNEW